jgi:hypothetical protein
MIWILIDLFDNSIIADLFWMFSNLNDSFYVSDWLSLFSRKISTNEFNDSLCIKMMMKSFRVFNASFIWRIAINFWTSFIVFFIANVRWVIVNDETFISIIREYVSNISKMKINSSSSIESLMILNVICRIILKSIFEISIFIIAYIRRSDRDSVSSFQLNDVSQRESFSSWFSCCLYIAWIREQRIACQRLRWWRQMISSMCRFSMLSIDLKRVVSKYLSIICLLESESSRSLYAKQIYYCQLICTSYKVCLSLCYN